MMIDRKLKVLTDSTLFTPGQIRKIEDLKNASYVCETCLKTASGEWANQPVAVFWNHDPDNIPAGGSPWFGLFYRHRTIEAGPTLMITNAKSAVETPFIGIVAKNGDVIYSRYRHDFRRSPDGSVWIDGGRDYVRYGERPYGLVRLRIVDDRVEVIPYEDVEKRDA